MRIISCILSFFLLYPCYSQTRVDSLLKSPKASKVADSLHFSNDSIPLNFQQKKGVNKKTIQVNDWPKLSNDSSTKKKISPTIITNKLPISNKFKLFEKKNDSLNIMDSLSSDSTGKKIIQSKSAAFLKKQLTNVVPKGNISFGYEYGVLPLVASGNYPTGGYKAEGKISFLLLNNVPLELTYYYTSIKNVVGLTNYFRISYDASRYKEIINRKLNVKNELNQIQLHDLQLQQQQLLKKIEYLSFLQQSTTIQLPKIGGFKNGSIDTAGLFPSTKTKLPFQIKNEKLKNSYYSVQKKKDSITYELNKYKAQYNQVKDDISKVQKEIDQVKNVQNNTANLTDMRLSKTQQFLSHIKKFEIGLCNPNYSTFLVNNTPLKGINVEYGKNNSFFAFTYGTTVNNLLYNPNTLQGAIQGARNFYNYFDFGNTAAGRKILCIKGGIGSKEGSHLFIGFLVGKGRTDYLLPIADASSPYTKQSNVVMEIDAKYKFSQQLSTEVILGKSSIQDEDLTMQQLGKAINEILSPYRSYALLTKIGYDIKKTATKFTFTTRWIDPYFKSLGIGFIRSDNLQYEIKVEQPITNKIKYSISYKHQEDNLLKLLDYKNTFNSINNSLILKITKQLSARLSYNPLFQELISTNGILRNNNQISTGILSFNPKAKNNVTAQFSVLFSKYIITSDSNKINFENFTYSQQFQFKSGFKTGANVSWFKNSLKDTLYNNTYLAVIDVGYSTKNNNSFTLGGKMAYKANVQPQYGFIAKAAIQLYKGLFWETSAEKIIIGDYYSSFMISKIKQFPFYLSTKLILNF